MCEAVARGLQTEAELRQTTTDDITTRGEMTSPLEEEWILIPGEAGLLDAPLDDVV